jgi:glyoxylase-like metal-dependent hydrolase (beta-lactamase superfamily II)
MPALPEIERFVSSTGVRIYRIPCQVFPSLLGYVHLLLGAGPPTLVDTGSGFQDSTQHVLAGIETVRSGFGEAVQLADLGRIIITHGHIDHFGGLSELTAHTRAEVAIHALDRRVLTAYEERVVVATKALRIYLGRAGVPADEQPHLLETYTLSKKHVHSVRADRTVADGEELDGLRFIHTPGHCPGQVCIAVGDVLLSADHVLERTTPHQSPESIMPYTGLGHFLESLAKVQTLEGVDTVLGGHERPFRDLHGRIDKIVASHQRKLDRVRSFLADSEAALTIRDLTHKTYSKAEGFHQLLALEEVGAHVEYLDQRGELAVDNLDEVEREDNPPVRYRLA